MRRRVRFIYMGACWSCRPETLAAILRHVEAEGHVPDLDRLADVRMLRGSPKRTPGAVRIEPDRLRRSE